MTEEKINSVSIDPSLGDYDKLRAVLNSPIISQNPPTESQRTGKKFLKPLPEPPLLTLPASRFESKTQVKLESIEELNDEISKARKLFLDNFYRECRKSL